MAYKFPCEPVGSPFSPPGTYGFIMLRSASLQNNINMMERYGVNGIVQNLRELLFRDGKRVDDDSQLPWNLFPDMKNPVRRPDKYFQMITDRAWESILVLIREVDSEVADEVLSRIHSGIRGGNNNPDGIGLSNSVSHSQVNGDNVTLTRESDAPDRGNSRAYTLNRLRRETPELFERVVAGKLSANAAAIEAGFRKKQTPIEIIKFNWKKLSEAERNEFLSWISEV